MTTTLLLLALTACDDGKDSEPGTTGTGTGDTTTAPDAVCTEPTEVQCVDEMILDLSLQDNKTSNGDVVTVDDGEDELTSVDASAGGFNNSDRNAWTYVKFNGKTLDKLDLDDESALESMDWDLALKRYVIRVNSGSSGPSCVGVAAMMGFAYEDISSAPDGVRYQQDGFYTEDCTLTTDSVGGPQVATAPWYSYATCVATTGVPLVFQLADGRTAKMRVEKYYDTAEAQTSCNETGSSGGAEGGYYQLRWRMLP